MWRLFGSPLSWLHAERVDASPLFRDIDTYQRRRIKKLKQQRGRGF